MVVSIVVLDVACGSSGCVLWLCVVFVVVCLWLCVCDCGSWMVVVEFRQGTLGAAGNTWVWSSRLRSGREHWSWLRSGREHWAWMVVVDEVRQGTLGVDGRG